MFRVEGGKVHDWCYHGIGQTPELSIPMESKTEFEPALYVVRGKSDYQVGRAEDTFTATWRIPGESSSRYAGRRRDVFSRITVAGVPEQTAFVLRTFPDPGAHSLMVRHQKTTAPFVAVHEAYNDTPTATGIRLLSGSSIATVEITHADRGRRLAIYESGSGSDGWRLAGRFGMVEFDDRNRLRSLVLIRGTDVACDGLHLHADSKVSLSVTCNDRGARLVSSPPVGYETLAGNPVYAIGNDVTVSLTIPARSSPSGHEIGMRILVPGQTSNGPMPVDIRW